MSDQVPRTVLPLMGMGGDPVAAVFGGLAVLMMSGVYLVLRRNHLRTGRRPGRTAWTAIGAMGGLVLYLIGLLIMGKGADVLRIEAWAAGIPWALLITMGAGALVAYLAGGRTEWHPAGVGVLGAMMLACIGWAAYLITSRIPDAFTSPTLIAFGLVAFLVAQLLALTLVVAVTVYMLDGLVRRSWRRDLPTVPYDKDHLPNVAVHVACYNEPPEVVARTLDSLVGQDYPRDRLKVMLLDDSTDPEDVERLRRICEEKGAVFLHRDHREGFKAGALNNALRHTPEEFPLVAVVDADFVADPDFLRGTVGYFCDPRLSFIQTRLDYSNKSASFTARCASLMERFFYTSMMRTRNEGNAGMFGGTMGLIRREAIEDVGGWTDGHVGEDVDLACRMLMNGWTSLYVPKVYGKGLQTIDQEAFLKQQARWAYGGARILRDHGSSIIRSGMTLRQKIHHLYPPISWLDGTLALLFTLSMFAFGALFLTGSTEAIPVRDLLFVGLIPTMIIMENMLRIGWTLRWHLGISIKEAAAMILMGWSCKLSNAIMGWAAVLGVSKTFHRTPKTRTDGRSRPSAVLRALRVTPLESLLSTGLAALAVAMTARLVLVGSGPVPAYLVIAAIAMATLWTVYFAAGPICIYIGHVTRSPTTQGPAFVPPSGPVRSKPVEDTIAVPASAAVRLEGADEAPPVHLHEAHEAPKSKTEVGDE